MNRGTVNSQGNVWYRIRLHGELYSYLVEIADEKGLRSSRLISDIITEALAHIDSSMTFQEHPLAYCYYLTTKKFTHSTKQAHQVSLTIPASSYKRLSKLTVDYLANQGKLKPEGYDSFISLTASEQKNHPQSRSFTPYAKAYIDIWKKIQVSFLVDYVERQGKLVG